MRYIVNIVVEGADASCNSIPGVTEVAAKAAELFEENSLYEVLSLNIYPYTEDEDAGTS